MTHDVDLGLRAGERGCPVSPTAAKRALAADEARREQALAELRARIARLEGR